MWLASVVVKDREGGNGPKESVELCNQALFVYTIFCTAVYTHIYFAFRATSHSVPASIIVPNILTKFETRY